MVIPPVNKRIEFANAGWTRSRDAESARAWYDRLCPPRMTTRRPGTWVHGTCQTGEGLPNLANLRANTIGHGRDVRPAGQPRHRPHRRPSRRTTAAAGSGARRAALAVPLPPRVPGADRLDTGRF